MMNTLIASAYKHCFEQKGRLEILQSL